MSETRLTHKMMTDLGFNQIDWFYNRTVNDVEFTVGFLFDDEFDSVDIFYGDTKIYHIPLNTLEQLKFLFELITKTTL